MMKLVCFVVIIRAFRKSRQIETSSELILDSGQLLICCPLYPQKGRIAGLEDGTVQYESRSEDGVSLEMLNIKEKQRFMDGEKVLPQPIANITLF